MASTYNKPQGLKYTDMAIFIDKYLPDIAVDGENPEIEMQIYEYLYHLTYALAYKAGYFRYMQDYDAFALYSAGELFMSMRKKQMNAGKIIRGKEVKPIKSSLNFIKSVLFPLKVNYQRLYFSEIMNPELGHDTSKVIDNIKAGIQQQYSLPHEEYYNMVAEDIKAYIQEIIAETPFKRDALMYRKLYFSVLLTLLDQLTLPNNLKNKKDNLIEENIELSKKLTQKIVKKYTITENEAILWHLSSEYSNYVKILVSKVKKKFSQELSYYIADDDLSDEMLTDIMNTAYENYSNDEQKD